MITIIGILLSSFLFFSCSTEKDLADAYGNFEVTEITIAAKAGGELLAFDLREGDDLIKGQRIGYVDTTYLVIKKNQLLNNIGAMTAKHAAAQLNYQAMETELEFLKKEKKRIAGLFAEEAATEQQKDKIFSQYQASAMKLKALAKEIESVEKQQAALRDNLAELNQKIEDAVIINPGDGTVLVKYKQRYEMAAAGSPLYTIGDLTEMYLRVYISADQLDDVELGQEVDVLIDNDATSSHRLTGEITWISSTAEFTPKNIQTKEVRIDQVYAMKIQVHNDGKIKNGMPGSINF